MRINKGAALEWSVLKEGDALIDIERTPDNYELVPYHEVLNPSDFSKKSVEVEWLLDFMQKQKPKFG